MKPVATSATSTKRPHSLACTVTSREPSGGPEERALKTSEAPAWRKRLGIGDARARRDRDLFPDGRLARIDPRDDVEVHPKHAKHVERIEADVSVDGEEMARVARQKLRGECVASSRDERLAHAHLNGQTDAEPRRLRDESNGRLPT